MWFANCKSFLKAFQLYTHFQSFHMHFRSSSSSSSFTVPSFPLLGLDVIWVASTVVYPLPYLLWWLASSCLLPLPYSRFSLAYLLGFYLAPTSIVLLSTFYSHPYILHDQTISTSFSLIYVQGSPPHIFFWPLLSNPVLPCILLLTRISTFYDHN